MVKHEEISAVDPASVSSDGRKMPRTVQERHAKDFCCPGIAQGNQCQKSNGDQAMTNAVSHHSGTKGADVADGDADQDGVVDEGDAAVWETQYVLVALLLAAIAVPAPSPLLSYLLTTWLKIARIQRSCRAWVILLK